MPVSAALAAFALTCSAFLLAACGAGTAPAVREPHAPAPASTSAKPGIQIRIHSPSQTSRVLRVEVEATGEGLASWTASGVGGSDSLTELTASDAAGELPVQRGAGLQLTFARPITGALSLRYALVAPDAFDPRLHVAETSFLLSLDALLLPRTDQMQHVRIEVLSDAQAAPSVATTLGGGPVHALDATPKELRDVAVMVGPNMQTARFVTNEGRDDIYALGGPSFDVRWAAAEMAMARSRIDVSLGRVAGAEFPWLIFARAERHYVPPVVVQGSGLGVRMIVTQSEPWSARTRIPVAQILASRWLGGSLRVGGDDAWLRLGFTRYVALRELFAAGTISPGELVHELNTLEAAVALDEPGPVGSMARGALYALRCEGLLRAHASVRSLGALLAPLFDRAEATGGIVTLAEFEARLREILGEAEVGVFRQLHEHTAAIALPRGVPGRCFSQVSSVYRRFALGFEPPDPELDLPQPLHGLVPDGPAARAGSKEGDVLHALRYVPGDPNSDVELEVERDGRAKTLRFKPSDRSSAGRGWKRNPAVRDDDCALFDAP
ncbi:MAG TPA: hypothetical protein VJR89_14500 [Polyangiales bacterium]|nr:hypothetical protein [Polyangiales bacterium]